MPAHSRIATLLAKRHDISYELFVINCTYIVSTQISTDISKKTFKAPVNVSRACITIQAGYVCVVRSGTAQDHPLQAGFLWQGSIFVPAFSLPVPPINNIGCGEEDQ